MTALQTTNSQPRQPSDSGSQSSPPETVEEDEDVSSSKISINSQFSQRKSNIPRNFKVTQYPKKQGGILNHAFLGIDWKFLNGDKVHGHADMKDAFLEHHTENQSTPENSKSPQSRHTHRSPPKKNDNGLVPEEPDMEDVVMDRIAREILEDETARLKEIRDKGLEDKRSLRGKKIASVIDIFQEHGDNRFARRMKVELEKRNRAVGNEGGIEVNETATLLSVSKDNTDSKGGTENRKHSSQEKEGAATEKTVEEKEDQDQDQDQGRHEHDIHGVFTDSFGGLETDDVKAFADAQEAIRNRPPSPVVFARTLVRLKIAKEVPKELQQSADLRKEEWMVGDRFGPAEYGYRLGGKNSPNTSSRSKIVLKAGVKKMEIPPFNPEKNIVKAKPPQQKKPAGGLTHRGRKQNIKKGARERGRTGDERKATTGKATEGRPASLVKTAAMTPTSAKKKMAGKHINGGGGFSKRENEKAPRYGRRFSDPKKWTGGRAAVKDEMKSKQSGSWGKEMAAIDKKARELGEEIPKLYIGKMLKQRLEKRGERIPEFLKAVDTTDLWEEE